jgi:DNA-binding NarL/FixJ family response regulator
MYNGRIGKSGIFMVSKTILVADNDVRFRSILTTTLEMVCGINRIIRACSLDSAVDSIRRHKPDTALLSYDLLFDYSPDHYEILKMQFLRKTMVLLVNEEDLSTIDVRIIEIANNIISKKKLLQQFSFIPGAVLFKILDRSVNMKTV